uniref:Uncharacterized protein n=1 Tax=viral metagenome TaxID=1070528 RepID=A0A6C0AZS1_9ZZZZ|tara:strand:+ start:35243 stop:37594 length:2352 start_codon:yes stop_codon:yes gene_type:complete
MSNSPKINLVENAAKFCNDLIKENVQIKENNGDLNTVSEYNLLKWTGKFHEIFPKLYRFSNEYKKNMSGVSSYTVRAMLGDAAYHDAINQGTNKLEINWKSLGDIILDYTTSFGTLQNIHDNHLAEISSFKDDREFVKKLYCLLYTKVKKLQEQEPKLMEMSGGARTTRRKQGTIMTDREAMAQVIVDSIITSKLPEDSTEEYKNAVIEQAKRLLLFGDDQDFEHMREKKRREIIPNPNNFYMSLEDTPQGPGAITLAIDKINKKEAIKKEQAEKELAKKEEAEKKAQLKRKRSSSGNDSSRDSDYSDDYENPDLTLATNMEIKNFIKENYPKLTFNVDKLIYCQGEGDKKIEYDSSDGCSKSTEPARNHILMNSTKSNCFSSFCSSSKNRRFRISPWVKHNLSKSEKSNEIFCMACMCCGLPLLPASANISSEDKYKNIETLKKEPSSEDSLKRYAGKTQCDHILPIGMMYFGLDQKCSKPTLDKIGIGMNFCPIHPECNTIKLDITPEECWTKNEGIDDFKWNDKWGESIPDGPWMKLEGLSDKDKINKWCSNNNWKPKMYAKILQQKYYSCLENLVVDNNNGKIFAQISKAVNSGFNDLKRKKTKDFKKIRELNFTDVSSSDEMIERIQQMFKMISLEEVEFVDAARRLKEAATQMDVNVQAAMEAVRIKNPEFSKEQSLAAVANEQANQIKKMQEERERMILEHKRKEQEWKEAFAKAHGISLDQLETAQGIVKMQYRNQDGGKTLHKKRKKRNTIKHSLLKKKKTIKNKKKKKYTIKK